MTGDNTQSNNQDMPEGFQPYAIIEERYIQPMAMPSGESGEIIQTSSRYVELLVTNSSAYDYLPTDVAYGSLVYFLDYAEMWFWNGTYWEEVGYKNSGNGNIDHS